MYENVRRRSSAVRSSAKHGIGVPCITLRNNTERPITVTEGTNTLAGTDPENILKIFDEIMHEGGKAGRIPEFWDGKAAVRIAQVIRAWIRHGSEAPATALAA